MLHMEQIVSCQLFGISGSVGLQLLQESAQRVEARKPLRAQRPCMHVCMHVCRYACMYVCAGVEVCGVYVRGYAYV
jgi:hypothetical protein